MHYQYLRQYQNYQLQCPKCKEVFLARDIHSTAPKFLSNFRKSRPWELKSKKQNSEQEDDEDLADCDPKIYKQSMQDDQASPALPRRRPSGAKKDATTWTVDIRDNSDLDDFPVTKRGKIVNRKEAEVNRKEAEVKRKEEEVERKEVEAKRKEAALKRKEDKLEKKEEELERKAKEIERNGEELRKMKDWLREEKEVQGKALEAARSWEAVERLVAKHKQQEMARDPGKGTMDAQAGRKFNRKKKDREQENDEDL